MTIDEIEKKLPNGLHDASLEKIQIDYVRQEAKFEIGVNIGTPQDKSEKRRIGILRLDGLQFCVIDPPDPKYPFQDAKGLWLVDSGPIEDLKSENLQKKLIEHLPKGAFIRWFFINDWNAFIYIAALDAHFEWA